MKTVVVMVVTGSSMGITSSGISVLVLDAAVVVAVVVFVWETVIVDVESTSEVVEEAASFSVEVPSGCGRTVNVMVTAPVEAVIVAVLVNSPGTGASEVEDPSAGRAPRIFSAVGRSTHLSWTPSAVSSGRAKQLVPGAAQASRTKAPEELQRAVCPSMQAAWLGMQEVSLVRVEKSVLNCWAALRFVLKSSGEMVPVAGGSLVTAVGILLLGTPVGERDVVSVLEGGFAASWVSVDLVVVAGGGRMDVPDRMEDMVTGPLRASPGTVMTVERKPPKASLLGACRAWIA